MRGRVGTPLLAVALSAALGCAASEPTGDAAPVEIAPPTTAVVSTSSSSTTTAITISRSTLPRQHLTSCVESAKFHAYTGNDFGSAVWTEAGQTDSGMRSVCEFMELEQPGWLEGVHNEWERMGFETAGVSAASTAPPVTQRPVGDPILVQGCIDWFNWHLLMSDRDVEVIWDELGRSGARLRQLCSELAVDDPSSVREMQREVRGIERFLSAPPTTSRPFPAQQQGGSGCHPNYSGCVPIASDVDCAGGSGNGPAYTGRVDVLGPEVYGLDRDGDGIGCE